MKGVIFTEFMEMVEQGFSPDVLERIIDASNLPSGGVYTTVGTYDHNEIITLVSNLSLETGKAVPELLRTFGKHIFRRFVQNYPVFFDGPYDAISFLERVDGYIHAEVLKLYPGAELPGIDCERPAPGVLKMRYHSSRPFADFAEGMIMGVIEHYREDISVERRDVSGDGRAAEFILTKRGSRNG